MIRSSTRTRCSSSFTRLAYWAAFSAARSDWLPSCRSFMRSHILKGAMPIAASGISTQIQAAMGSCMAVDPVLEARLAQGLDLGGGLVAAVGDDPLDNLEALLKLGNARGVVGGLFGGQVTGHADLL